MARIQPDHPTELPRPRTAEEVDRRRREFRVNLGIAALSIMGAAIGIALATWLAR